MVGLSSSRAQAMDANQMLSLAECSFGGCIETYVPGKHQVANFQHEGRDGLGHTVYYCAASIPWLPRVTIPAALWPCSLHGVPIQSTDEYQ